MFIALSNANSVKQFYCIYLPSKLYAKRQFQKHFSFIRSPYKIVLCMITQIADVTDLESCL